MLKWLGVAGLPGIPARDLTDEEVKEYGGKKFLLDTGLYSEPDEKPARMTTRKSGNPTLIMPHDEDSEGTKE